MNKTWIVIPTYWTDQSTTGQFDHPTPVNKESTLPRLLNSLQNQTNLDFHVLILAGAVTERALDLAAGAIRRIIKTYTGKLSLHVCDHATLNNLYQQFDLPSTIFNLTSYAGIRNLQLLIPNIAGAEVIIALDDDEIVDLYYIRDVLGLIGKTINNQRILGLAGPYADENGHLELPETRKTGNIFFDKPRIMNAGLQALVHLANPVTPSPQVFGGNMIFHREMFTQVGFDPGISRGEDMDYMINAYMQEFPWFLAADLRITHLPPKQYDNPAYAKLKQDVRRFVYERAKLQMYNCDPAQFDPYPGRFLRDDLDAHALEALNEVSTQALITLLGSPQQILDEAYRHMKVLLPSYATFRTEWSKWMAHTAFSSLRGIIEVI
ncbi:MAG: glycosyltransferase family 2 protein [Chloroflexi bacterium]|nr:glycosyltransferase family 2 protein [Chloroflexota bacterium]